jgi:hypothetical protein
MERYGHTTPELARVGECWYSLKCLNLNDDSNENKILQLNFAQHFEEDGSDQTMYIFFKASPYQPLEEIIRGLL